LFDGERTPRAAVRYTSARIAIPPIACGHIDMRKQADVACALRSGTPA
jgi:hypothetical protein